MYFISTYWYGIGVLLAIAIGCFWYCGIIAKSKKMNNKFIALGDMKGKTLKEIEDFVGIAKEYDKRSAENTGEMVTRATWSAGKYQIVIMFDKNEVFNHIVSQGMY